MWWCEFSECLFCVFYKMWVGINSESVCFVCYYVCILRGRLSFCVFYEVCVGMSGRNVDFVCFVRYVGE
jgi:hypothetical protein